MHRQYLWALSDSVRRTCDSMVAPSFVTVISPSGDMRILSKPLGPCSLLSKPLFWAISTNVFYQRSFDNVRDRSCGHNMRFHRLDAVLPFLLLLAVSSFQRRLM